VLIICCVIAVTALGISTSVPAQEGSKHKREKFAALAHLPSGAGRRMVGAGATGNVDLYVNSYTSDEEAKSLAALLVQAGPDALLKALENIKSKGKVTLTGHVS